MGFARWVSPVGIRPVGIRLVGIRPVGIRLVGFARIGIRPGWDSPGLGFARVGIRPGWDSPGCHKQSQISTSNQRAIRNEKVRHCFKLNTRNSSRKTSMEASGAMKTIRLVS